ncbi:hypothetical protein CAPTEDRAFT_208265 [Capitella teleta]|uniref:STING ligand-binding domain-containing protein n=1 Tax=Capitella teleta TaxID=283909 RepID=R7U4R8_CAPTE|nr:hypothetical protein CAPTEDRAFT_208265 [Capitella teleta]|eukprot:ELT98160.1 hypothetical protein CAPTEDRAFT_208265 [Capitella teleta]
MADSDGAARNSGRRVRLVGDLGYAMAAVHFFGFLEIILPGLEERINKKRPELEDVSAPFIKKFICIIPKSCRCPCKLNEKDGSIRTFPKAIEYSHHVADKRRDYATDIHKFNGKQGLAPFYFSGGFCASLKTLHDLTVDQSIQLSEEDCIAHRDDFTNSLRNIIRLRDLGDRVEIVEYNDDVGKPPLSVQIIEAINKTSTTTEENIPAPRRCGDLGQGMAWNYYYGYLRIMLPTLAERIKESLSSNYPVPWLNKFICIIAKKKPFPESFTKEDTNINPVHPLEYVYPESLRPYSTSMQIVCRDTASQPTHFMCLAELCTPIRTLHEMAKSKLLTEEELWAQINLLEDTLKEIIQTENLNIILQTYNGSIKLSTILNRIWDEEQQNQPDPEPENLQM